MAINPVLGNVRSTLRRRFDSAKAAGTIPANIPFSIKSFPITGSGGRYRYQCVDQRGRIIEVVDLVEARPTVCDYA